MSEEKSPPNALRRAAMLLEQAKTQFNPSEARKLMLEARDICGEVLDTLDDHLQPGAR
jgi:hypothetical protein